jgi:hypothetical protein
MKNRPGLGCRLAASILLPIVTCLLLATASAVQADGPTIDQIAILDATGNPSIRKTPTDKDITLGLRGWLAVVVKGDTSNLDLSKAVLALNGSPIPGLTGTRYPNNNTVIFHLLRNSDNHEGWAPVLGSPDDWTRQVTVTLQFPAATAIGGAQIIGGAEASTTFQLKLISGGWLAVGIVVFIAVVICIWRLAQTRNLLKDSLLPQIPPELQTFSLGRCQMAWWSALIVGAFLFLLALLWDYNTVTAQALVLMGISSATAMFAIQVDASKDTPIGRANENLKAIDLNSWTDVEKLKDQIKDTDTKLKAQEATAGANAAAIAALKDQLVSLNNNLRTYQDTVRPFQTEGWWKDITTDVNGPALHRLQVVVWTVILGGVFVAGVYRDLAMPEFSATLLALMGVADGAYVGFKVPEKQS